MARKKSDNEAEEHEDFLALFRRGLKFTEELLAENEKLRFRVASLENENSALTKESAGRRDEVIADLRAQIATLEAERRRLLDSYREVEKINRDHQQRYAEIEEEHNNLANLYIASYQLHATLAFREVVQVISEIVINLVGVSSFTMYLLDAPSQKLYAIAAEGREVASVTPVKLGDGLIGKTAKERGRHIADSIPTDSALGAPLAVITLATIEHIVGAIAIDKLLVQKSGFTAVDNELFNLLAVHAATALLSGLLRDQVGDGGVAQALSIDHARKLLVA